MKNLFVHLRQQSNYSLLESSFHINDIIDLCKTNKMPAIALTDTQNMFGSFEFSLCCKKNGIQPILGLNLVTNFFNDKKKFSRTRYEKFLLENNISASQFEDRLKKNELQKILFNYINGGLVIPKFLINKKFANENKDIELHYVSLEENYKKDFTNEEVDEYINSNEDKLKKDFINFSYVKITPQTLLDVKEYNDEFFKIIDEIDDKVLNNENIELIANQYNLKLNLVNDYYPYDNEFELIYFELVLHHKEIHFVYIHYSE